MKLYNIYAEILQAAMDKVIKLYQSDLKKL